MSVRVQEAAFDVAAEMGAFQSAVSRSGAVVSFTGLVRDDTGSLEYMFIEHYPGMTEAALQKFADQATEKFGLEKALVIHRHGRLQPGEAIMMVATAAGHRKDAFAGADYLMDYLKSRAPFWKKEVSKGGANWVAAKDQDEAALAAWSLESAPARALIAAPICPSFAARCNCATPQLLSWRHAALPLQRGAPLRFVTVCCSFRLHAVPYRQGPYRASLRPHVLIGPIYPIRQYRIG